MKTAVSDLHVLVVDDDTNMRQLLCRMLKRMGAAEVHAAANGEEVLRQLENQSAAVDLVIADWNMPGMSGIQLFQKARAARPKLLFLLLTGRDDAASIIAAKQSGVPAYVVKPVTAYELEGKISYLLRHAANANDAAAR